MCSRGHVFYKSSLCPVCPTCWPGQRKRLQSDFPEKIGAPALRGLHGAKLTKLSMLTKYTEKEMRALHGVGPKAIRLLKDALRKEGKTFKKN